MPAYIPPHLRKKKKEQAQKAAAKLKESKSPSGGENQSIFGKVTTINIDITDLQGDYADLVKTPLFSHAYLSSRRKQHHKNNDSPTEFYWIRCTMTGETIDIGLPQDWNANVASKIKAKKCHITKIHCERKKRTGMEFTFKRRHGFTYSRIPSKNVLYRSKKVEIGEHIVVSVKTERGRRVTNEDRYQYVRNFERLNPKWDRYGSFPELTYIAVFDGHGGKEAADWACEKLHKTIALNIGRSDDLCEPIMKGYLQFDHEFCNHAIKTENSSGAVAVTVIVQGQTLYVANIGDCAAVLCRGGDTILLSDEHNPLQNEAERKRVYQQGGSISCDGRVNGDLAVSRAFGDVVGFSGEHYDKVGKMIGLTCVPVVKKYFLTKDDEFLILACDGIFDYVNYKNATQLVRRSLRKDNDPAIAATRLVDYAIRSTSLDNLTCAVVGFPQMDQNKVLSIVKPLNYNSATPVKDNTKTQARKFNWGILKDAIISTNGDTEDESTKL